MASSRESVEMRRWIWPALLFVFAVGWLPSIRQETAAQTATVEQQLAERFAPIAFMRQQREPCDRRGSVYFPAPVDVVLGNPEVALKRISEGSRSSVNDEVVKFAPTAEDLAGLDEEFYLDFPGNPRRPGCTYGAGFLRFVTEQGLQPTTYARVFVDQEADKIILQYWFWYYFNDWNNTHEGDWERVHLVFDATTVAEALREVPTAIGYAQHGGGEIAEWNDEKLTLLGDRPLVYPAAGAQASFFEQRLYIGWGENGTGFGCDDTTAPSRQTPLNVVLLPNEPTADGEFAWLTFEGRWGERQPWEFNGPRGPNLGTRWSDPLASMESWRSLVSLCPSHHC